MKSNRGLLIAAYRAFNARDIDTILAMMHPDVDWPNGMEGGRVNGQENVRRYWMRQWGILEPHVELSVTASRPRSANCAFPV
jgi:ketosteroid isomerase-like protein